jgi:hypothetical protein
MKTGQEPRVFAFIARISSVNLNQTTVDFFKHFFPPTIKL